VNPLNMSDNVDQSWYIGYTPKELDDSPRGGAIKLGLLWEL
jgi:hypothetical protein